MIHILTSTVTPRLRYIVHLLFDEILGTEARFIKPEEGSGDPMVPCLLYGSAVRGGSGAIPLPPRMPSSGWLEREGMEQGEVPVDDTQEVPVLFPFPAEEGLFPFDLFAAAFFLVTRYEEYGSPDRDRWGRYPATASLAWHHGFLEKPVVNLWLNRLVEWLQGYYPWFRPVGQGYRYRPTLDIDHAYAYRFKGAIRTAGGVGRSLLRLRPAEVVERFGVVVAGVRDPFDTYDWVQELHDACGVRATWFILTASYGGDDNNIDPRGRGFEALVAHLQREAEVGLHPSLASVDDIRKLASEVALLGGILGKPVLFSRQHFLRFSLPDTYRHLISVGITDDFSMGYASHPGFRAGIAHPFRFYDLEADAPTPLTIHPLPVMDVTFRDYLRLSPGETVTRIQQIVEMVRLVKGEMVTLWHNESLSDRGRWKGWRSVYHDVVHLASSH